MNSRMKKHTIFSRFSHTLKYIFLTGMMCTYMTACGNTDGQSAAEQSETEIIQDPLEETPASLPEPILESEPESTLVPEPMPATEPALEVEQEEVIDYTQANTEKFYQYAEEVCGLSHKETQRWFDIITDDGVFDSGFREISDLIFDDIDDNGMTDMVIMVQEPQMEYMPGKGAVYFYMNEEPPYCFMGTNEYLPFFRPMNLCHADLNGDGNVEIALALNGFGNGGSGDWYKVLFSYTGSTMERLEFPSDSDDEYEVGLKISVIMEPEQDTYTAYCPYLDESITFQARNIWEGETQLAYLADAPKEVGYNIRGYYDLKIVTWQGRDALQVREYLCGEGGNVHCVGEACFILVWDEQGNGSVADWWVEGNLGDSGLIFYSAEDLTL